MKRFPRISALFDRIVALGASPSDTPEQAAHKSTQLLISVITAPVVVLWSVVYGALGLRLAAVIPVLYAAATVAGVGVVARTGRFRLFRSSQLTMWLVLPFVLQGSVGGFGNGSAVGMWAIGAPLMASLVGAIPTRWFLGFVGLAVASGFLEATLAAAAPSIPGGLVTTLFVLNFLGVAFVIFVSLRYFFTERERARVALEHEQARSERLLLNILPAEVAHRLKSGEEVIADRIDCVTILFADLVGSTPLSEKLSPDELVRILDGIFTAFDDLAGTFGLEKVKTIGDAYMVAGGLPPATHDHAEAVAEMAMAMREELARHPVSGVGTLTMRFGIHMGSVVAGVIGRRKFSYDMWGDAVNTAARMESHGIPGQIQVTEEVYRRLRDGYSMTPRGPVDIKGKGVMNTYLLTAKRIDTDPASA